MISVYSVVSTLCGFYTLYLDKYLLPVQNQHEQVHDNDKGDRESKRGVVRAQPGTVECLEDPAFQ